MKCLKSTLAIVALLTIGAVDAKQIGKPTKALAPVPTKTRAVAPSRTFNHLQHQIDKHKTSAMTHNNKFTQDFIKSVQESNISNVEKMRLLNDAAFAYDELIDNHRASADKFIHEVDQLGRSLSKTKESEEANSYSKELERMREQHNKKRQIQYSEELERIREQYNKQLQIEKDLQKAVAHDLNYFIVKYQQNTPLNDDDLKNIYNVMSHLIRNAKNTYVVDSDLAVEAAKRLILDELSKLGPQTMLQISYYIAQTKNNDVAMNDIATYIRVIVPPVSL